MSTDYNLLHTPQDVLPELSVLEHSNKFDIFLQDRPHDWCVIEDLTLEQLKSVRDKLSQVISYFE